MGVSTLLDLGNTALNAQALAINVTGENITNVNTPGYSKQTTILETAPTTSEHGFPLGNGVKVSTIQRSYDAFLQSQLMSAGADSGQAQIMNSTLQTVQPLFNDLSSDGLGKSLQIFFTAWQDLAANPQGIPERQAVLSDAAQVVDDFHRIATNLNGIKTNMDQSLQQETSDINDTLNQIASLNATIKQTEIGNGNANELRDQRELLMRQLSQKVGVTFTELSDGTVNVNLTSGQALVTGKQAASLSLQPNAGTGYSDVMLTPPGGGGAVVATSFIGGPNNSQGEIGGTLQIRDTVINKYLASLDELSATVANQVNAVHAAGYGLKGSTGVNFFTPPASVSGFSSAIAVNISNTDEVAAANADTSTGATGNNINAQAMAAIYNNNIAMSGGTMTLEGFYNSMVGTVGVDVQSSQRTQTQVSGILTQLNNQRESLAGVSLDEELINLTKYQKAYQGAAKIINVGADMLDTVLGLVK